MEIKAFEESLIEIGKKRKVRIVKQNRHNTKYSLARVSQPFLWLNIWTDPTGMEILEDVTIVVAEDHPRTTLLEAVLGPGLD